MNTSIVASARVSLLALGCALSFVLLQSPAAGAESPATANKTLSALPLKTKIDRVKTADGPRFVLNLTNTSKEAVKVTAVVQVSVAVHNSDKFRTLPEHTIAAGQAWSIPDLVALDKVTVKADGYAPLEVLIK